VARKNKIIKQEREELRDVISKPQIASIRRTTFSRRESIGERDIEEKESRKAEDKLLRSL
jgi:hypothetical protein